MVPEVLRVDLEVTRADIYDGMPYQGENCPIAYSLRRAAKLDPCDVVEVDLHSIEIRKDGVRYEVDPGPEVTDFIEAFDEGRHVEPFAKELCFTEVLHCNGCGIPVCRCVCDGL